MELVVRIEICSATGETEVMNQTLELPDTQNNPINEGERAILDLFALARTQAYSRYLAAITGEPAAEAKTAPGGTVVENATRHRGKLHQLSHLRRASRRPERLE